MMLSRVPLNSFSRIAIRHMSSSTGMVDVKVNEKTGVATVTMQRPPVCGLNLEMVSALLTTFRNLDKNKARGMILTSALPTIFSGGIDIFELYQPKLDRFREFWINLQDMWLTLYGSRYPTVAAINGHSPAGGCLLACSCEYRVMVKNEGPKQYAIGLNETKLGISLPHWFFDSFTNVLPIKLAERAVLLGKMFPVDEALTVGLIDEVAKDKDEAILKAEQWLSNFNKIDLDGRWMSKKISRGDALNRLTKYREEELKTILAFVVLPQVQKGLGMYLESLKKK